MRASFEITLVSTHSRGKGWERGLWLLGTVMVFAWLAWFFLDDIRVVRHSVEASLVAPGAAEGLVVRASGRVERIDATIGDDVKEGQVILIVDAEDLPEQIQAASNRLAALESLLEITRAHGAAQFERQAHEISAVQRELRLLDATRLSSAEIVEAASGVAGLYNSLEARDVVSAIDALRAKADLASAHVDQLKFERESARLEDGLTTMRKDHRTQELDMQKSLKAQEIEVLSAAAAFRALQNRRERFILRAPAPGRLASLKTLRAGDFVGEGDAVGSLVREGPVAVDAWFLPEDAIGYVRAGQAAEVVLIGALTRVDRTFEGVVHRVSDAPERGLVRATIYLRAAEGDSRLRQNAPVEVRVAAQALKPYQLVLGFVDRVAK